tara:strand:+ start:759 stop:1421 length:663 start_codon:yes stop_codon:yes gene_type:complete
MQIKLEKPDAILFDLDGTLADTYSDLALAVNKMESKRGLSLTPSIKLRSVASSGAKGILKIALNIDSTNENYLKFRDEFLRNYNKNICVKTKLFDGIKDVLDTINKKKIKWGIVTNKLTKYTHALLPKISLSHADCIVCGDTTKFPKPSPEPLFEAVKNLNLSSNKCWYIGDDLRDIQAGKAAKMLTFVAGWGYCSDKKINDWEADHILKTPRDLISFIS